MSDLPSVLVVGVAKRAEKFLANLFRGLAARGVRITIFAKDDPGLGPGIEWLPSTRRAAGVRLGPKRRALERAAAGGDVVYFPWNSAAVEALDSMPPEKPTVVSCRGSQIYIAPHDPSRAAFRAALPRSFERATAVHCVSEAIAQEATAYGLDRSKSVVIRPAVDETFFAPPPSRDQRDDHLRVVSTGSLLWRKGHEYALMALRRCLDRGVDAHLTLIGDGSDRRRILYTIGDLGLHGRVTLAGRLEPHDVRRALWDSDVFLLASVAEGISNAVLEAMACGLPVVSTDCGGMAEAVTDHVEGRVVPVRDADSMGAALIELASEPELRAKFGASARTRVEADFRLTDQIDAFVELFGSAVKGSR